MIKPVIEKFYREHSEDIDVEFAIYCFYEGRFEFQDRFKMFNNDDVFWEFVERYKEKYE